MTCTVMPVGVFTLFQDIRTAAIRTLTALVHMECSPRYFEQSNLRNIKKFLKHNIKKSMRGREMCSSCSICVKKTLTSLIGHLS